VRDPLHPKTVTSFTDMGGYMHPHSYVRLPNGNVLVTFQHVHHGENEGQMGGSGGLVEIDNQGRLVRSASSADPSFPGTRAGSKTNAILELLKRPDGVTAKELMKVTGWQPHSVRGFLSGTIGKKMGLTVTSTKGEDGERSYSIKS
jgi:hypothetical protein